RDRAGWPHGTPRDLGLLLHPHRARAVPEGAGGGHARVASRIALGLHDDGGPQRSDAAARGPCEPRPEALDRRPAPGRGHRALGRAAWLAPRAPRAGALRLLRGGDPRSRLPFALTRSNADRSIEGLAAVTRPLVHR